MQHGSQCQEIATGAHAKPASRRQVSWSIAVLQIALLIWALAFTSTTATAQNAAQPRANSTPQITRIISAGVSVQPNRTCFSIFSKGRLAPEIYTVRSPDRVVVDATAAVFRMPEQQALTGGRVGSFRYGLIGAGQARIVIDVAPGTRVGRVSSRRLANDMHALSISLSDIPEGLGAPCETARMPIAGTETTRGPGPETKKAAAWGGRLSVEPSKRRPPRKPVIVIDPGHGGIDPGAVVNKVYLEKLIVLAVARRVAKHLRQSGRFEVVLTRETDKFVSLDERVERSRRHKGDIFISLHADSLDDPTQAATTTGAAVYILSHRASDAEAKRLADKENSADRLAGILPKRKELSDGARTILVDLLARETERESARLRKLMVDAMRSRVPVTRNPRRSAAFQVLRQTETPAVLIELGYMTNPGDLKRMRQAEWQEEMAKAIASAAARFFPDK